MIEDAEWKGLNLSKSIYLAVIYNTTSLPLRTVWVLYNQKSPQIFCRMVTDKRNHPTNNLILNHTIRAVTNWSYSPNFLDIPVV